MIAKLYHTYDLESLAKFVTLFYEEQPADFTYLSFNPIMLQFRRRISDPTIFQHMGRNSSLPGKIMEIQDPHFSKDLLQKILKGDNPPATLETSISINSVYSPESAYKAGFGHFWSESKPRKGDYFRIKFESPQVVSRIIIASGMKANPTDIFYDAIVETSSTLNKANNCTDYELKGKFINGTADISNLATIANKTSTYCIQIRVMKNNPFWVLIQEIDVFLLR
jgi:alpha-1,3-mannosylglycoprotein beta-1,4-N-acetylglucosaminyltransferase C